MRGGRDATAISINAALISVQDPPRSLPRSFTKASPTIPQLGCSVGRRESLSHSLAYIHTLLLFAAAVHTQAHMLQPVVPRDGDEQLPRLLLLDLNVSEERQVLQEDTVGLFTTNVVNGPNAFCRDDEDHWQPVQRIGRRRLVGCMQDITITIGRTSGIFLKWRHRQKTAVLKGH